MSKPWSRLVTVTQTRESQVTADGFCDSDGDGDCDDKGDIGYGSDGDGDIGCSDGVLDTCAATTSRSPAWWRCS